jgi:hypothetical protein
MPISKINTTSITDNSVTAGKIVAGAVDADIAAGSIDTAQIADDAVTTAKIPNDAVTADKLANAINTSIDAKLPLSGGTITGNVGIAKTSLATWSSGYNALQVGGRGFVGAHTGSDLYVGQNASFNSGWKYEDSSAASLTQHSGGKITHFVAPAGTAGNAISWNTAMDITPTGKIGIATSSPQADLHIGNADGASRDIVVHTMNNGDARLRFREGSTVASGFNEYSFGMDGGDNALTWEQQGNGEVARFTSDGNLVIGGTVAGGLSGTNAMLTVRRDTGNAGISYQCGTAPTDQWETYANLSARYYIENVSTSNGAYLQYNSSSGWTNVSDQRWKTDWTLLEDSSSKITALNIGKYHMLNDSKESIEGAKWDYGVKAQELLEVIPDAVDVPETPEDKYGVVPNIVFWHTVKALQEALAKIDAMETRLSTLEDA